MWWYVEINKMIEKLKTRIKELEDNLNYINVENQSISQRGVDWHLDHSLKVIIGILKTLQLSNPKDYSYKFNYLRTFCLTFYYLPRGKAKAPKAVNNEGEIQINDIKKQIEISRSLLKNIESLNVNSYFKHPYFGLLNLKQSLKFIVIHTNHHLKIINEIKNK